MVSEYKTKLQIAEAEKSRLDGTVSVSAAQQLGHGNSILYCMYFQELCPVAISYQLSLLLRKFSTFLRLLVLVKQLSLLHLSEVNPSDMMHLSFFSADITDC